MRVVKCIKECKGLEVGKLYEVSCDNYDVIHLKGFEENGFSRDKFEYVIAAKHKNTLYLVRNKISAHCAEVDLNGSLLILSSPNVLISEIPVEPPKQDVLTKYNRSSGMNLKGELSEFEKVQKGLIYAANTKYQALGVKHDNDKIKPSLLLDDMPNAINEVLKVLKFGADKYSEGNWLKVENGIERYRNAADRHRLSKDEIDDESGLLHLAHEAVNVLMLLELKLKNK